jgi:hypothetical protein
MLEEGEGFQCEVELQCMDEATTKEKCSHQIQHLERHILGQCSHLGTCTPCDLGYTQ